MQPDPDLQLRVAIKALRDVVMPSLDPENALANEQLQLTLATLEMVRSRLPMVHEVARKELENAVDLARSVDPEETIAGMIASAEELLGDSASTTSAIDASRISLLDEVSKSLNCVTDSERRMVLARSVIAASKSQCDLARGWSLPGGFERDPQEVPILEGFAN
ncbi:MULTISPECIES: hypothetical protein [unclassified Sphingomonas]|jgi:hypothetical protein|uniref:hypothetical protein n=1 Tax=unclassified Sphingomonas TaxID=196159 RepID=UPI0006F23D74|nr:MULTISPECIES: hypothetical protein [unclassified Sphingomonas]KQX24245.1 hypothetical protein ASD17_25225 [Sphingomonas sp. Root1294]KQY69582.1 hypothetical protein ASD39_24810 [Sphingomonas sp. Root50]KRB87510.1 hypothetical protein ASE22_24340 [Sphingomonas sp. Root720]